LGKIGLEEAIKINQQTARIWQRNDHNDETFERGDQFVSNENGYSMRPCGNPVWKIGKYTVFTVLSFILLYQCWEGMDYKMWKGNPESGKVFLILISECEMVIIT
jgi:hypothetical protein